MSMAGKAGVAITPMTMIEGTGKMKCPKCNTGLQMTNKHGIRINHCPSCRGKWFDHGELERLLKRMSVLERSHAVRSDDISYGDYRVL
jgi:Zn-finger nucleic acid-binding protein